MVKYTKLIMSSDCFGLRSLLKNSFVLRLDSLILRSSTTDDDRIQMSYYKIVIMFYHWAVN